jgi:hypothetical protein
MRPTSLILAAALVAGLGAAVFYRSLSPEKRELTRAEFAKILLQGGVIGALGVGAKALVDDWERTRQEAITARKEEESRRLYFAEVLRELRRRFAVALENVGTPQRAEYPGRWWNQLSSSGGSLWPDDASGLLTRIRMQQPEWQAFAGIDSVIQQLRDLGRGIQESREDQRPWDKIAELLGRGYKMIDAEFWQVSNSHSANVAAGRS